MLNDCVGIRLGQFYFTLLFKVNIPNLLCKIDEENAAIKCVLLPIVSKCNKIYYIAVSSKWLTLDHTGEFEIYKNLNIDIKLPS